MQSAKCQKELDASLFRFFHKWTEIKLGLNFVFECMKKDGYMCTYTVIRDEKRAI
jgi:hypothetical protein